MANIFPSSGNAGIGTTTPPDPLTIDLSMSPPAGAVKLRIKGPRSPTLACGADGTDLVVGQITQGADYFSFGAPGDSFLCNQSNTGKTYLGRSPGQQPIISLENAIGRIMIGSNTLPESSTDTKFVVERIQSAGSIMLADFILESAASAPSDSVPCRFIAKQIQSGSNTSMRAIEGHVIRKAGTAVNGTWGMELGVHSQVPGNGENKNVGIFISSHHTGWQESGVRADSAILIVGEDGWTRAIMYRDIGDVAKFEVDYTGTVRANVYATYSSGELKQGLSTLDGEEAVQLVSQLTPVRFAYKTEPDSPHFGFVAEDTPAPFAPDGKSVSLMDVLAAVTRVVQDQQEKLDQQQRVIQSLTERLDRLSVAGPSQPGAVAPP